MTKRNDGCSCCQPTTLTRVAQTLESVVATIINSHTAVHRLTTGRLRTASGRLYEGNDLLRRYDVVSSEETVSFAGIIRSRFDGLAISLSALYRRPNGNNTVPARHCHCNLQAQPNLGYGRSETRCKVGYTSPTPTEPTPCFPYFLTAISACLS